MCRRRRGTGYEHRPLVGGHARCDRIDLLLPGEGELRLRGCAATKLPSVPDGRKETVSLRRIEWKDTGSCAVPACWKEDRSKYADGKREGAGRVGESISAACSWLLLL